MKNNEDYLKKSILFLQILAAVALCISSIIFVNTTAFLLSIVLVSICIFTKLSYQEIIFMDIIFTILFVCIDLSIKGFGFMPQAKVLLLKNSNIMFWIQNGHMHRIRLVISYPGFIISEVFGISLDKGFSYYCVVIFCLILVELVLVHKLYKKECSIIALTFYGIVIIGLFFVMNGRIAFAFLGMIIAIKEMYIYFKNRFEHRLKRYFAVIIAIILSTVSSGTMIVVIVSIIILFCISLIKSRIYISDIMRWSVFLMVFYPMFRVAVKYIIKMVNKNITFFGGGFNGIINMLQHGIGKILPLNNSAIIYIFLCIGMIFMVLNIGVIWHLYKKYYEYIVLIISVNIGLYGSLFGISTGTMVIMPIVLLIGIWINNKHMLYGRNIYVKQA